MDAIYSRQQTLELIDVKEAVVVGTGGTGTPTAMFLAMSRVATLHLMDGDNLEPSNLNRLPFTRDKVGQPKVQVLNDFLTSIRPDIHITTYPPADRYTLEMVSGTHLFDCTDRHSVQVFLSKWAKAHGMTYIRCGYDGLHITVCDAIPEWGVTEEGGYEINPSWVVPAFLAAAIAVLKAMKAPEIDVSGDITEMFLPKRVLADRKAALIKSIPARKRAIDRKVAGDHRFTTLTAAAA